MSNFDERDSDSVLSFVLANLPRHTQFALSTVSADGSPWTVCVNSAYDEKLNFIWKSLTATEHSKNIANDPRVSICVFGETAGIGDFGFYCKALAREVTDEKELAGLLAIRYKGREVPSSQEFLGSAQHGFTMLRSKALGQTMIATRKHR